MAARTASAAKQPAAHPDDASVIVPIALDAKLRAQCPTGSLVACCGIDDAALAEGRWIERLLRQDGARLAAAIGRALDGGPGVDESVRCGRDVGSCRRLRFVLQASDTGGLSGAVVVDPPARGAAEPPAEPSEAMLQALIDAADAIILLLDHNGRVLACNQRAAAEFETTPAALIGRQPPGLMRRAQGRQRLVQLRSVFRTGHLVRFEDRDGSRTFEHTLLPVVTADGRVEAAAVFVRDITAIRRATEDMRRFRAVVEASQEAIAIADTEGELIYTNRAYQVLYGLPPASLPNGRLFDPIVEGERDWLQRELATRLARGGRWEGVVDAVDASGRQLPVWLRAGAARGSTGEQELRFAFLRDFSDERGRQHELQLARDTAERASAAKTRFIAAASHDLRQPLQAAAIFIDLVRPQVGDAEAAALIDKTASAISSATEMLHGLLDISQLDSGAVEPEPAAFEIGTLLERIVGEFAPEAAAKGVTLDYVACTVRVRSDRALLERMVRNLVSNAVRYTDGGRMLVGCRRTGEHLRIQVHDTGIGMTAEQLEAVFEEYYQVANPTRDRRKGLGLGLAIVDRIGRLLGHAVAARSTPGAGSVFEIEMPRAAAAVRPASEREAAPEGAPRQALIVLIDDEPDVLEALTLILDRIGHRVVAAQNARNAWQALQRLDGTTPDLIIADYRLTDGEIGLDAIDWLRSSIGAPVPAVLLSGDVTPDRQLETEAHGLQLIAKPITPASLRRLLIDVLG